MATPEQEQEIQDFKDALSTIEDLINDAEVQFKSAFQGGYESCETYMDRGFEKLQKAKALM